MGKACERSARSKLLLPPHYGVLKWLGSDRLRSAKSSPEFFMTSSLRLRVLFLLSGMASGSLHAQPCVRDWTVRFPNGDVPIASGYFNALCSWDSPSGRVLVGGGAFSVPPNVLKIGAWNGVEWRPFGTGLNDGKVFAVTPWTGPGPSSVFAGGEFTQIGGVSAKRIASWNGTQWSALGAGVGLGDSERVTSLVVFDDGTGPALYAGGFFTTAGGSSARRIAKWNGAIWSPLGNGLNDQVHCLLVHDDGSGAALFAGGKFTTAGTVSASRVAKWNGSSWSALGDGLSGTAVVCNTLAAHDDGSGMALYAGGSFQTAGVAPAANIARWRGGTWAAVGPGLTGTVRALSSYDDSGGHFLAASTGSIPYLFKWDGGAWSLLAGGLNGPANASLMHDAGDGAQLYVGGEFGLAGNQQISRIARLEDGVWHPLTAPFGGTNGGVNGIVQWESGFVAAGGFSMAGGIPARNIAYFDGTAWEEFAGGITGTNARVEVLARVDRPGGADVYAGGLFSAAGGVPASNIVRWDGAGWQVLGPGLDGLVYDIVAFDDGSGPSIFVAGEFDFAGTLQVNNVARWDGLAWHALDNGIPGTPGFGARVETLTVHDDGTGPAIYAGGFFDLVGQPSRNVAKWDGTAWIPLGTGVGGEVRVLASFDSGTGPALYVGGNLQWAGPVQLNTMAKWQGGTWSEVPNSPAAVYCAQRITDCSGTALYFGGDFGAPAARVAKWNGTAWSSLGAGLDGSCQSMAVLTSESGPALVVGGQFYSAGNGNSRSLAIWGLTTCYPNCDGSTAAPILNVNDFTCFLNKYAAGDSYANCDASTLAPVLNVNDFTCFLNRYAVGCP